MLGDEFSAVQILLRELCLIRGKRRKACFIYNAFRAMSQSWSTWSIVLTIATYSCVQ
jgi:hypothetical protein